MPRIDEVYPSQWLRAIDLEKQARTVTIERVTVGEVGSGEDQKTQLIAEFAEYEKPLGLNKTNAGRIGDVYGPDTDDWIGQKIVIFPTKVDFNKQQVDAIRVDKEETMNLFRAAMRAAKKAPADRAQPPWQLPPSQSKPNRARPAEPMTQQEVDENEDIEVPF